MNWFDRFVERARALPIDENAVLGLDLGIASCGTAWLRFGSEPAIAYAGARCFPAPEGPDKESNNAARRQHRLSRRVLRRRARRMREIRQLLAAHQLLSAPAYDAVPDRPSPWACRADALRRRLTATELAVALIHIARHRGFQSTSKRDRGSNAPPDSKAMLKAIAANSELSAQYETAGEMIARDPRFGRRKRNAPDEYGCTLARDLLRAEVRTIFERQRRLLNPLATVDLERAFADIAFYQRAVADSERMVGTCTFLPDERRAARQSYGFELFRFLGRIGALRIIEPGGVSRRLSEAETRAAIQDFGDTASISYRKLRRLIGLHADARFERVKPEDEGKPVTRSECAEGTRALHEALGETLRRHLIGDPQRLDAIAFVLAFRDDVERIRSGLVDLGWAAPVIDAVMQGVDAGRFARFKRAGHLSSKACWTLIPEMLRGKDYTEACAALGWNHAERREGSIDDINSPVVRRALREGLRQAEVLILEFGIRPGKIHVELSRDVGKGIEERQKIEDGLEKRRAERERNKKAYLELVEREDCPDEDVLRYELWREQNERCIYTDEWINPRDVACERSATQVDHILPRSRSQDNSYHNKVLCLVTANQNKRNRSPYEWKKEDAEWWQKFEVRVEMLKGMKGIKKRNLLMRNFAEREQRFVRRNENDTRWACRVLLGELARLYDKKDPTRRLLARPGPITALLRQSWGLEHLKKDAQGNRLPDDRHHAVDAIVTAAAEERTLQRLTRLYQEAEETLGRHGLVPNAPPPWVGFRNDVIAATAAVQISRSEDRRARGQAHDATIRRVRPDEDGRPIVYERKSIEKLTAKDLERLPDPDRNLALRESLAQWIGAGKPKAEAALPRSPKGDVVRKVRLRMGAKAGIAVRNGHADNGEMVRADVFRKDGKFHVVPIYIHQVADKERFPTPPDRAIVAYKDEDNWTPIDGSYEFCFSLYPDSYVEVAKRNGEVIEGYYRGINRSTAAIVVSPMHRHDDEAIRHGIGTKTLASFRKYQVDRLGRRHSIVRETRTWRGVVCT